MTNVADYNNRSLCEGRYCVSVAPENQAEWNIFTLVDSIMYFVQMNHNGTVNSYHIHTFYNPNIINKHLQLLDLVLPEKQVVLH